MREEIKAKADKLGQNYFPDECNVWARENIEAKFVSSACIEIAEWMQRKNIKKKAHETMDERDFVLLLQWLRKNHPDVLDSFHATQPKKKPFAKLKQ